MKNPFSWQRLLALICKQKQTKNTFNGYLGIFYTSSLSSFIIRKGNITLLWCVW